MDEYIQLSLFLLEVDTSSGISTKPIHDWETETYSVSCIDLDVRQQLIWQEFEALMIEERIQQV